MKTNDYNPAEEGERASTLIERNTIRSFWVVTKATADSELADILFEATPERLMLQTMGGLRPDDLVGVYRNELTARLVAEEIMEAKRPACDVTRGGCGRTEEWGDIDWRPIRLGRQGLCAACRHALDLRG